uniref:ATP synthase peripheral stalk subunit F6, mitochondrial n=1 Tax=Pan troglodytes TaxID=9598 RepID=A0A2I3TVZ3_PANTR
MHCDGGSMILQRIFRFSSVIWSAGSVHLRRNVGVTAVAFFFFLRQKLDPLQKLFMDKIREYKSKRQTSGGPVDTSPQYQQVLERELLSLNPKFEVIEKPQA